MTQIQFDEYDNLPNRRREVRSPGGLTVWLMRVSGGSLKNPGQANLILLILALVILGTSIFFMFRGGETSYPVGNYPQGGADPNDT